MIKLTQDQALDLAIKKHNNGKFHEAEIIYKKILEQYPENHNAIHLLGLIAHQNNNYLGAVKLIEKAIQIKPSAMYYGNIGMSYDALGKDEESAKNFEKALKMNPVYGNAHLAHYNLGVFYKDNGKITKALDHYNKAIELKEDFTEARWNRSLILLLLGKFDEGWKEYGCRFKKKNSGDSRFFNKPCWTGSKLEGKKILVVSEQGFGDNIQFIRFLQLVKERGGNIVLECKKELRRLFKNLNVCKFVEKNSGEDIEFDYYIHIMDLPRIFGTNLDNIPATIPYLKADNAQVEKFKEKFNKDNLNVGIVWHGNPHQKNDKNRSTEFEKFKILKEVLRVKLYSLQAGSVPSQLNDPDVIDLSSDIKDFADVAAIIENLDLVISVDTSVAHLAGAMGKQIWTLLTKTPDWRWLLDRADSPWYPSMKLFRQSKKGDWDSLFEEVKKNLQVFSKMNGRLTSQ